MVKENFNRYRIQFWIAGMIIPIALTVISAFISVSVASTRSETKIEYLEKNLDTKAERNIMIRVEGQLNRIESKLDTHIENTR